MGRTEQTWIAILWDCNIYSTFSSLYQAMDLYHAPLSLLAKAAPILTDETFENILPLAWELLLVSSQQLAGAAGNYGINRLEYIEILGVPQ